jgi:hypothetical protein
VRSFLEKEKNEQYNKKRKGNVQRCLGQLLLESPFLKKTAQLSHHSVLTHSRKLLNRSDNKHWALRHCGDEK